MATTTNGIYYPNDYNAAADIPADLKKMAESIDKNVQDNKYNDKPIKQDIQDLKDDVSDIKTEQETQNDLLQRTQNALINITTPKSSNINVKDSSNLNAKINVFGISKQETRSGKNKANSSAYNYDTISYQDLDVNLENNEFTISTDSLRIITEYVKVPIKIAENGTYTFGLELKANTSGATAQALVYDSTNKKTIGSPLQNDTTTYAKKTTTITIDDTVDKSNINVLLYCNGTVGNAYSYSYKNIFVNPGQDAEFEQYGASPSPEFPSEIENVTGDIEITVYNKNLFNNTKTISNVTYNSEEDKWVFNLPGKYDHIASKGTFFKNIKANTNYTIYLNILKNTANNIIVFYPDKTIWNTYFNIQAGKTGIIVNNIKTKEDLSTALYDLWFSHPNTITGEFEAQIMICEGAKTDNDYVKYEQQTITFPLVEGQKLTDGDYLASDGIHHVRDVYIFKAVTSLSSHNNNKYGTNASVVNSMNTDNILSDRIVGSDSTKENTGYITGGGGTVVIYGNPTDTVKSFNEKFVGTKIEYPLAKETIEPYTPEQQEAYNKLQNVLSYYNVTNVFTDKALLEFKYIADTQTWVLNKLNNINQQILEIAGGN